MRRDTTVITRTLQTMLRTTRLLIVFALCGAAMLHSSQDSSVGASQPVDIVPSGIGLGEEGARPAETPPRQPEPAIASAASPVFAQGVFTGPTAWNANQADFYRGQANRIRNGDLVSQVDFLPQEISSWDPDTYLTGGMAYAVTVISGLQRGDIVYRQFKQEFTYDYTSGQYTEQSSEDPLDQGSGEVYILIDDYNHNAGGNRIFDWINYSIREADGSYTLVMGQSNYWLLPSIDSLSFIVGYGFRMSDDFAVYRGATLLNPQISARGYQFSVQGVGGRNRAVIATQSYVDKQNVVAAPVVPRVECVADNTDGTLTAHFGYENRNVFAFDLPVNADGSDNFFAPGDPDRGQPTRFEAGSTAPFPENPFSVTFAADETLSWTLDETTVTASADSPACGPIEPVRPILECVTPNTADDSYTAFFGYENPNDYVVSLPAGPDNFFAPDPQERGQPETFAPGLRESAFRVEVDDGSLAWTLQGETVTATRTTEECEPTAVTLVSFTADATGEDVVLNWETATETDNAGFNLYRSTRVNGTYTKVNDALIPAAGDPITGAAYQFTDRPGTGTFYYKLADIDLSGVETHHGPITVRNGSAAVRSDTTIHLPIVLRN